MNLSMSSAAAVEVRRSIKLTVLKGGAGHTVFCSKGCVHAAMAEGGDNSYQFPPFTAEQLQWIDRLISARTEPVLRRDNVGGDNLGEDTATSVPSSGPVSLVKGKLHDSC